MRIEESITINRSAEDVFAFFDDRRNDHRWMGSVVESEWIDPGASTDVGRRGRMVMNVFGTREFSDAVTEYEPGRRVAHRSVSGSVAVRSACLAEPVAEGTRATFSWEAEHLPGGRLAALGLQPLLARAVRRGYRADLARLKRLLEDDGA
jgi:uncharacterized membrane protein